MHSVCIEHVAEADKICVTELQKVENKPNVCVFQTELQGKRGTALLAVA